MTELFHGTWWDLHKKESLDKVMNGRFTKLLPDLDPAQFDQNDLRRLAGEMTAKQERKPTPGERARSRGGQGDTGRLHLSGPAR